MPSFFTTLRRTSCRNCHRSLNGHRHVLYCRDCLRLLFIAAPAWAIFMLYGMPMFFRFFDAVFHYSGAWP